MYTEYELVGSMDIYIYSNRQSTMIKHIRLNQLFVHILKLSEQSWILSKVHNSAVSRPADLKFGILANHYYP